MEKSIYQDNNGLYFVEYDQNGNPQKVYCDEAGNPLVAEEETLEIFQQEDGTYYYVAYNELGEAYKVPCDENGNEIIINEAPYVAPVQNNQTYNQQVNSGVGTAAGAGFASAAAAAATYPNQAEPVKKKSSTGFKTLAIALLSGALVMFGGYFAYSQFSGNGNSSFSLFGPTVNMEGYMVDVKFSGNDGDGKAEANISAIPNVKISDASKQKAVDALLTGAEIKYSKQTALKNGDKISVSINVDEAAAEKQGVKLEGAFNQSFTVAGLSEEKESSSDSKKESSSDSKESSSDSKKESSSDSKESSSDSKKESSEKPKVEIEYKQVYNTGYKGLLMRTGPSQSYPAIATLFDGTPVKILGYEGNWANVDYNGKQGWMYTGYLR